MSFYEDREEKNEEDGEFRKKKPRMCFVSEYKVVFFPTSYLFMLPFILPDLTCFMQRRRDRDVIL